MDDELQKLVDSVNIILSLPNDYILDNYPGQTANQARKAFQKIVEELILAERGRELHANLNRKVANVLGLDPFDDWSKMDKLVKELKEKADKNENIT